MGVQASESRFLGESGSDDFLGLYCPGASINARQLRKGEEEYRPGPWWTFHVLTPILHALGWGTLRGVLLSRGNPRGCGAQHTIHEEEEEEEEVGNEGRKVTEAASDEVEEKDRDKGEMKKK